MKEDNKKEDFKNACFYLLLSSNNGCDENLQHRRENGRKVHETDLYVNEIGKSLCRLLERSVEGLGKSTFQDEETVLQNGNIHAKEMGRSLLKV